MKVTRRRGRRYKQLFDDLREKRGFCKLKEESLDGTEYRIGIGGDCRPDMRQTERQTTKWLMDG
jgi:hypothetical protein